MQLYPKTKNMHPKPCPWNESGSHTLPLQAEAKCTKRRKAAVNQKRHYTNSADVHSQQQAKTRTYLPPTHLNTLAPRKPTDDVLEALAFPTTAKAQTPMCIAICQALTIPLKSTTKTMRNADLPKRLR
jgi:hypothetical protein